MIAPFTPHIAEELWQALGNSGSIFSEPWPQWDDELAKENEVELVVQINGKVRAKLSAPAGLSDDAASRMALDDERVKPFVEGKEIKKVVVVKGRLVNIVAV